MDFTMALDEPYTCKPEYTYLFDTPDRIDQIQVTHTISERRLVYEKKKA